MSVLGGRRRWARGASIAGAFGLMALASIAACGGRTSTLDPEVYELNNGAQNFGGASAGKSSGTAGRKPVGVGGGKVIGEGGTSAGPGSLGVDSTLSQAPCTRYCPGYTAKCQARLMGRDCFSSCQGEVDGSGPKCQALGISALDCLTPFFATLGGECETTVNQGLMKCGDIVAAFESCKTAVSGVTTPGPMPTPMPTPVITRDVTSCSSMGDAGDQPFCKRVFACAEGTYETYCEQSMTPGASDCACISPRGGAAIVATLPSEPNPCFSAGRLCNSR